VTLWLKPQRPPASLHGLQFILYEDRDEPYPVQTGREWYLKKDLNEPMVFKRDKGIRWLTAPPESPDMSPIENYWNTLEQKFLACEPTLKTKAEKKADIHWNKASQKHVNELILGKFQYGKMQWDKRAMWHHWEALYENGGQPTGFWVINTKVSAGEVVLYRHVQLHCDNHQNIIVVNERVVSHSKLYVKFPALGRTLLSAVIGPNYVSGGILGGLPRWITRGIQ